MKKEDSNDILSNILDTKVEEIEVPLDDGSIVKVKVQLPSVRERLEAKAEVSKLPFYKDLSQNDKMIYESNILHLKILREPKISVNDFLNSADIKIMSILDTVALWYSVKINNINNNRKDIVNSFLAQMKGV